MRLAPIAGYLGAGVAMGPFTPGFVGDAGMAERELAFGMAGYAVSEMKKGAVAGPLAR